MSQNLATHFSALEALEKSMNQCKEVIRIFLEFLNKFTMQCAAVQNYKTIKETVPDSFVEGPWP
jgi:hypothetical protein